MSRILHVFRSLPINLTRHFSGPRLCWCCGCRAHPVCSGWCVALRLLHLFFLHRGGCTERVEDDVLVFFPIARLRVRFGFDVALEEWNEKPLSRNDFYCFSHCKCARSSSNSPQGFCCRCWILRESLVGSWSGPGCLEMESGLLWGATQALLSAALTLAGRSGKPLAWESPRPPQGLCRRKRGSAVMS